MSYVIPAGLSLECGCCAPVHFADTSGLDGRCPLKGSPVWQHIHRAIHVELGTRLRAEAGRGALGAGAGRGQLLRVDEWRVESHGSPFIIIIITVTPLSKLWEQYLLGINMLK